MRARVRVRVCVGVGARELTDSHCTIFLSWRKSINIVARARERERERDRVFVTWDGSEAESVIFIKIKEKKIRDSRRRETKGREKKNADLSWAREGVAFGEKDRLEDASRDRCALYFA